MSEERGVRLANETVVREHVTLDRADYEELIRLREHVMLDRAEYEELIRLRRFAQWVLDHFNDLIVEAKHHGAE